LKDGFGEDEVDAPSKPPDEGSEGSRGDVNRGEFPKLEGGGELAGFILNFGWSGLTGGKESPMKKEGLGEGEDEEKDGAGEPKSDEYGLRGEPR